MTADRVELSMSDQNLPPAAADSPAAPLPGGGFVRVAERDGGASTPRGDQSPDRHSLALRYDAPALGAVDLRFDLDSASLRLSATLRAGEPYESALDRAGELRDALADATGLPVTVDVSPRREPLDVYA